MKQFKIPVILKTDNVFKNRNFPAKYEKLWTLVDWSYIFSITINEKMSSENMSLCDHKKEQDSQARLNKLVLL